MVGRAATLFVLMSATAVVASVGRTPEAEAPRRPLAELPRDLEGWHGREDEPLAADLVSQLGVDDYVTRQYIGPRALPVSLYIGYYASQRQGDTIHSPQNCLPGAGWLPVESGLQAIGDPAHPVAVNRYVITKGMDRQVVLYWYQGRGRVVANEYMNKALLMLDAARLRRTNGGLVRLIAPVLTTTEAATSETCGLAGVLLPHLSRYLP